MALGFDEIARRDESGVEVRAGALRLKWKLSGLLAQDGRAIEADFHATGAVRAEATERRMFVETFLSGRAAAGVAHITDHFTAALTEAAAQMARSRPALEWLTEAGKRELIDALKKARERCGFACGLDFVGPFELNLRSLALERESIMARERAQAEEQAAARTEHLRRTVDLLAHFEKARTATGLTAGAALVRISEVDRFAVLEATLMSEPAIAGLWIVAGTGLWRIEHAMNANADAMKRVPLPETLGALRSVQNLETARGTSLTIGAQRGIYVRDIDAKIAIYADDIPETAMGFSNMTAIGDMLFGCHGEGGIVGWQLGNPDKPAIIVRPERLKELLGPDVFLRRRAAVEATLGTITLATNASSTAAATVRNLCAVDDRGMIASVGAALFFISISGEISTIAVDLPADIVGIVRAHEQAIIIAADGEVMRMDIASRQIIARERRAPRTNTAALLPWLDETRLLLAADAGPIACVGLTDSLTTQYQGANGVKAISAATGVIAGLSADRSRIHIWDAGKTGAPVGSLHIPSITRHRVAGLLLA